MSTERDMVGQNIGERVNSGKSPVLRKRRTREYIPSSRVRQRVDGSVATSRNHVQNLRTRDAVAQDLGYDLASLEQRSTALCPDQNMTSTSSFTTRENCHLQEITQTASSENSQINDRYQILKTENKILRERLQNALQREMKALKTFKRLAKENRQLKLSVRRYEKTLLGLYDEDSDSDNSDPSRENEANQEYNRVLRNGGRHSFIAPEIPLRRSKSSEIILEQANHQHHKRERVMKTACTSTDDLLPLTAEKSTSTADLDFCVEHDTSNESSEPDNLKWTEREYQDNQENLTDASKVQVLQQQLQALHSQSMNERRKYSTTRRYWTDPVLINNGNSTSTMHKASSSPSLLEASHQEKKSSFIEERRVSDSLVSDKQTYPEFSSSLRHASFHDEQLTSVPEVTVSADDNDVTNNNPDSRSSSTSSGSASPSPILPFTADGATPQRSRNTSPLTIDVVIGATPKSLDVPESNETSSSPQSSPHTSPMTLRRRLGQSQSLPSASMKEYISMMQRDRSGTDSKSEEDAIEEVDEDGIEDGDNRLSGRDGQDDDIFLAKTDKKASVSLRFAGNINRENAQDIAADIAAFLQYRQRCRTESLKESKEEKDEDTEDLQTSEAMVLSRAKMIARRRGSAVVSFPDGNYKMDLHVLGKKGQSLENKRSSLPRNDVLTGSTTSLNSIDAERKSRWSILRRNKKILNTQKEKERQIVDFKECLAKMDESPRPILEHELQDYKDTHWTQLTAPSQGNGSPRRPLSDGAISDQERKRREAVWELCHSEIVYTLDHLLVLNEVFLDTLRNIQQMGHLQNVDPNTLFCNLEGLVEVSTKFAKDLLLVFQHEQPGLFGSTAAVVSAFTEFRWKVHPQYQTYCLNYSRALGYLDSLKKSEDFQEYLKWCESDPRCNRLQLTDLLVAPLQHLIKYPLLLKNIRKRTTEGEEQHNSLSSIIKSVELSIQELETKVKSGANLERLQELQKNLVWPAITELDSKAFIPEFLRPVISRQPCENLLASPKRQLLYEGILTLHENAKVDVYAFLFDDMLLLTRFRKFPQTKSKKMSFAGMTMTASAESPPVTPPVVRKSYSGGLYTVYKQPIPLDRFIIYDAEYTQAGSTIKNSFVIIHYSRFKQTIGLYTLQAPSQNLKETWTGRLKGAQSSWSDSVAQELAAESQKIAHAAAVAEPIKEESAADQEVAQKPEDSEETAELSQTEMLSYHKPIESQC